MRCFHDEIFFISRFQYLNVFLLYIEECYLEFMMNQILFLILNLYKVFERIRIKYNFDHQFHNYTAEWNKNIIGKIFKQASFSVSYTSKNHT